MQRLCNYNDNFVLPPTESNKVEVTKNILIRILTNKLSNNLFFVSGKDRGREAWNYLLVDWGKKEQFLERSRLDSVDSADYGRVLESGWGCDAPQYIKTRLYSLSNRLSKNFVLVRFPREGRDKTYYVMSDPGLEREIMAASSVEVILRCGRIIHSSSDEDPAEALTHVIEMKYFGAAEEILSDIDNGPFDAARNGDAQNVRYYLERGVDINSTDKNGWAMLHHAAHCGNMDVIRLLEAKGANIHVKDNICGRKPVHIAVRESHQSAIEFFLINGASVNETDKNNWTLIHYTAWKGDLETVKFLLQNDADINNAKDVIEGSKPIHIAAEYGNADVIEILLENNANIEDFDNSGRTPLYYAAWTGQLEAAKFLIAKGADIFKTTKLGTKPIHAAANGNIKEMIELFLDHGLNVDEQDGDGVTALHRAADSGNLNIVQLLVDKEANLNAVDKDGKTPFDYGKLHTDVGSYLANKVGNIFQEQGKYSDALKVYKEMLEIQQEKLRHDHPETLNTHNKVAVVLYEQGKYDEAVDTFQDVIRNREMCLGANHGDTLSSKHGLGLVYNAQLKYDEAIVILKEVFEKRVANFGVEHHDTLKVARDMGYIHFKKDEYEEAFNIFKDVFEKRRNYFGMDHPDTLQVRQDIIVLLDHKGDYKELVDF